MFYQPKKNCALCPRLVEFRENNKKTFPSYYNAPVPSFGSIEAEILIIGLAPGLKGANQTGRPFTNDYAGDILYPTLQKFGLAKGNYQKKLRMVLNLLMCELPIRCVAYHHKIK